MSRIGLGTFTGDGDKNAMGLLKQQTDPDAKKKKIRKQWSNAKDLALGKSYHEKGIYSFADLVEKKLSSGRDQVYHGLAVESAAATIKNIADASNDKLIFKAICTHMCDAKVP